MHRQRSAIFLERQKEDRNHSIITPSLSQLKRAIAISEKIEALQAELASLLGGSTPVVKGKRGRKPGSKNVKASAEGESGVEKPAKKKKGKRNMSAEARAKIAEAQKKRWEKRWEKQKKDA